MKRLIVGVENLFSFMIISVLCLQFVSAQSGLPECDSNVPFFNVDLSGSPDMSYETPNPIQRQGQCCDDGTNENYVSFYVTLHPDVAMFEILADGAIADGSSNYTIISGGDLDTEGVCGTQVSGGSPVCITGEGPHKITYSKPGSNRVKYEFRQIPRPVFPDDVTTRIGCSLPLNIYGLDNVVINSVNSSTGETTPGFYNDLLDCTDCDSPIFTPGLGTPEWIDFEACGSPQAAVCGSFASCGTFRVYTQSQLNLSVSPNPAGFCEGGSGVLVSASASGGDGNYSFIWRSGTDNVVSTSDTYTASTQETFTVELRDSLNSPTCSSRFISVPVTITPQPVVDAGPDQSVCAQSPQLFLAGSVENALGGSWSGGSGTFDPSPDSLLTLYTPSESEIAAGTVTLTLSSVGAGGGCDDDTDQITITINDSIFVNPTVAPIVCDGETTTVDANVSGGTPPFTYNWSTGDNTDQINVSSGGYSVMVQDDAGCVSSADAVVSQPDPLIISVTTSSLGGPCEGQADISISGGVPPYSITWYESDGVTVIDDSDTSTLTDLCQGAYVVEVEDQLGCIISSGFIVNTNPLCSSLQVSIESVSHVSCFGESDGQIEVSASGGTGPYQFTWNTTPEQTGNQASGLSAGAYEVIVTDANDCESSNVAVVTQPTIITNTISSSDATSIGGSDGQATANPQGGTPPYSYLWSPTGQTSQTASGLSEGVYHVAINDDMGCVKTDSVQINQPPCNNFIVKASTSSITCNGDDDGSAYVVIAHGTPPYSISWSSGQTDVTSVSGLESGSYSVEVTDQANCMTFATFEITEPAPLSLAFDRRNISCNRASDGTIDLTVVGGVYPYTYQWYQNSVLYQTTEDLVGLPPATYSVEVVDANGCEISGSIGVTQPSALGYNTDVTDITCNGDADGEIDVQIAGGVSPYSYSWGGPDGYTNNTSFINNLEGGLYSLEVVDQNGCTFSSRIEGFINEPLPVVIDSVTVACPTPGSNEALVDVVTVSGGNEGDYQISFDNDVTYQSAGDYSSLLEIGTTHSLYAMDVLGCKSNEGFDVEINSAVQIDEIAFDPCIDEGQTTVNVIITPEGGDGGPYEVSYDGGSTFQAPGVYEFELQVDDNYDFVIKDNSECSSEVTSINVPEPFTASALIDEEVSCLGESDGSINLTVNGGVAPYDFSWTGVNGFVSSDQNINDLEAGDYSVVIQDQNDCSISIDIELTTIVDTIPPTISCVGNQNLEADENQCFYSHYNTFWDAIAEDNCAIMSLEYELTGATTGTGTSLEGVNFEVGETTVTWIATDNSGNTSTCTITIEVIDTEAPSITCAVPATEYESDSGSCFYTAQGTEFDPTAASDNCGVDNVVNDFNGTSSLEGEEFPVGTTEVEWTVTDVHGNTSTCTITIEVIDTEAPSITCAVPATEYESDSGSCFYTAQGTEFDPTATSDNCGVDNVVNDFNNSSSLEGEEFPVGTTEVEWTVTDVHGNTSTCTITIEVIDTEAPVIECAVPAAEYESDSGSCFYTAQGTEFDPTATSDNCGVDNVVNDFNNSSSLEGEEFPVGTTEVEWTVTDIHGNTSTCSITIEVIDTEEPVIECVEDISSCDPYVEYEMPEVSDNCGVEDVYMTEGLASGSEFPVGLTVVTFEVLDIHGNTSTCSFEVLIHETPSIAFDVEHVSCFGLGDGSLGAVVTGGVEPYTYEWSNQETGSVITSLEPGIYEVHVTDSNGCQSSAEAEITEPSELALDFVKGDISCYEGNDGFIDLDVSGGTPPYEYSWAGGELTSSLQDVTAGEYFVTVTDANECVIEADFVLNHPDELIIELTVVDATCEATDGSISAQVTGGTSPYQYDWDNGGNTESIDNLGAGAYVLVVTDDNQCVAQADTTVLAINDLVAEISSSDVICHGEDDGSAWVVVDSGTEPIEFLWSNGDNSQLIENLEPDTYTVAIIDANGCELILTTEVNQPDELILNISSPEYEGGYNVVPYGGNNGSVYAEVYGGNEPYTYLWSNGEQDESLDYLTAGEYTLVVTDNNGCTVIGEIELTQPYVLEIPSGFSPNGDGKNDYFVVRGLEVHPNNEITIFNRWGNVVYQMNNYDNKWDGRSNSGGFLPDATYFVVVNVETADGTVTLKGYVDLRR